MQEIAKSLFVLLCQLLCFATLALGQNFCEPPMTLDQVTINASNGAENGEYLYTYEVTNGTAIPVYSFQLLYFAVDPRPEVNTVPSDALEEIAFVEPTPEGWESELIDMNSDLFMFIWSTDDQPIETDPVTFMLSSSLAPGNVAYSLVGLVGLEVLPVPLIERTSRCVLTTGPAIVVAPKSSQSITFDPPITRNWLLDEVELVSGFASDTVALVATATSGLAVSFRSESPSVCSISNTNVEMTDIGVCEIAAFQDGNEDYLPADDATRSVPVFPFGDYDLDGHLGTEDINRLASEVASLATNLSFDLDANGSIQLADVEFWLDIKGSLQGDLNLNGTVGFPDFLVLADNFGKPAEWSAGDLDADGSAGFPDFLLLANNFGQSANPIAEPVPEPAAIQLFISALTGCYYLLRSKRPKV